MAAMDEEREKEKEASLQKALDIEKQKKAAFEKKIALSETAIESRKALSQHRILAIRKEQANAIKEKENSWQKKGCHFFFNYVLVFFQL